MKKLVLTAFLLCAAVSIQAQQTIPASGGEATGSGGGSSYSVGQLVYTTNTDTGGTVSQGVQQSFELFTLSNPELTTINLTAVTYPNPTSDYIVLKITDSALDNLSYKLIDVNGKAIANGRITNADTQIAMQNLAIGMYILKVNQNNQELKTFKVIKK